MTLAPLTFDFPLMSALSVRAPHAVGADEMAAEAAAELADRRALLRRLAARGAMTPGAADERHVAIMAAIAADLDAHAAGELPPASPDRCPSAIGYFDKVRELRRTLAIRRNSWPKRVAKPTDPLDAAAAARRMEAMDAVHFLYWVEQFRLDDALAGAALPCPEQVEGGSPGLLASDRGPFGLARAFAWRVWDWERRALAAGDPAARPAMAPWYADMETPGTAAHRLEAHYRACAEAAGFTAATAPAPPGEREQEAAE